MVFVGHCKVRYSLEVAVWCLLDTVKRGIRQKLQCGVCLTL